MKGLDELVGTIEKNEGVFEDCITKFGLESQLNILQEECAELIQACSHYQRGRIVGFGEITEEAADVINMILQIGTVVGLDKIEEDLEFKLERTKQRLRN